MAGKPRFDKEEVDIRFDRDARGAAASTSAVVDAAGAALFER